jgi:PAS domain S-box-containing protein
MNNFQQLADFIPQIVWTARPDGYIDYYNKQWYDYTGFAEGYGDHSWTPILHPDDVTFCLDTWYNSVQTGEGYQIEYRFIDRMNPDTYRWFLGRASPIKDEHGNITRWFGTCTDIDDQKRQSELLEKRVLERTQALSALNMQLQHSNENLLQFASIASHDLQEPLRKIYGYGDLVLNQYSPALGPNGVHLINRMQTAARRMSGLIKDLLSYSRITATDVSFEPVSLNQIVSDVVDDLEVAINESNARVDIDWLPNVQGSTFQLRQLFQNLLANALKFVRSDVPCSIRVSSRQLALQDIPVSLPSTDPCDRFWEISVQDNGIGFDEKYVDRIFQVFERLHSHDEYNGTGVGLSICRKVAEAHGGNITARSSPNEGATFLVYLPV